MSKLKLYGKRNILYKCVMYLMRIFPIDEKKVVVSNFRGEGFYDNPKYIIEKLFDLDSSYKIFWLVNDEMEVFPGYIKKVKIHTIRQEYGLMIVENHYIQQSEKDNTIFKLGMQAYLIN
mgnify:CR=1 FL=1